MTIPDLILLIAAILAIVALAQTRAQSLAAWACLVICLAIAVQWHGVAK